MLKKDPLAIHISDATLFIGIKFHHENEHFHPLSLYSASHINDTTISSREIIFKKRTLDVESWGEAWRKASMSYILKEESILAFTPWEWVFSRPSSTLTMSALHSKEYEIRWFSSRNWWQKLHLYATHSAQFVFRFCYLRTMFISSYRRYKYSWHQVPNRLVSARRWGTRSQWNAACWKRLIRGYVSLSGLMRLPKAERR